MMFSTMIKFRTRNSQLFLLLKVPQVTPPSRDSPLDAGPLDVTSVEADAAEEAHTKEVDDKDNADAHDIDSSFDMELNLLEDDGEQEGFVNDVLCDVDHTRYVPVNYDKYSQAPSCFDGVPCFVCHDPTDCSKWAYICSRHKENGCKIIVCAHCTALKGLY